MEVAKANPGMAWVELDIEDPESISAVATMLTADYPKLNVLINNAGIMNIDDASSAIDDKLLVSTLTTNVMGPIRMTGALIEAPEAADGSDSDEYHIGSWIRSVGRHGRIFVNQGGNAFVHDVPSVQAQRHAGQGSGVSAAVGADRPAWQQQRTQGNAASRVYRGDDATSGNRCRRGAGGAG